VKVREVHLLSLPHRRGDRLILAVLAATMAAFFTMLLLGLRKPDSTERLHPLLRAITMEALSTFTVFSLLGLFWAFITPRWLETTLRGSFRKVLTAISVVLIASAVTVAFYTL
jgi:hypothetical protein